PSQALQRQARSFNWRVSLIQIISHEMNDGFRVRIRLELVTLGCELLLQLLEVLDDSIVDDGDPTVHMRMGIALDGPAVSRPPRMPDASTTLQRLLPQPHLEVLELAFRAAPV